jgi:hypothetical protein
MRPICVNDWVLACVRLPVPDSADGSGIAWPYMMAMVRVGSLEKVSKPPNATVHAQNGYLG